MKLQKYSGELTKVDLEKVEVLQFEFVELKDISALAKLPRLKSLFITEGRLSDIGSLKELTQMETLELNGNHISDISTLEGLTNIMTLILQGNKITDVTALASAPII